MIGKSAKRELTNVFGTRKVSNWTRIGFLVSFLLSVAVSIGIVSSANPFVGVGLLLLGGFIALSVAQPTIGGLFIILSSPLDVLAWNVLDFHLRPFELFTIATLLGLLLQVSQHRRKFFRTALDWPILAFWLSLAVTLLINGGNRFGSIMLVIYGILALEYFVLVNVLQDQWTLKKAIYTLVMIGDVVAVTGFLQVANYYLGLQVDFLRGVHYMIVEWGRPMGTFTDPGLYGMYAMFVFLLLLPLLSSQNQRRRSFFVVSLIIQIVAIFLSFARVAWIGALVGLLIFTLTQRGFGRKSSVRTMLYVLFFISIVLFVWGRLSSQTFTEFVDRMMGIDREGSFLVRVQLSAITLDKIVQKPIFGYGIGSWGSPLLDERVLMGPNMFISIMYDAGIFGLVSLLWLLIALLKPLITNAWRPKVASISPSNNGIFLGLSGMLISFLATAAYNYNWFWVILALGVSVARVSKELSRMDDHNARARPRRGREGARV